LRSQAHSKNLRLHRWIDASASFFITKSLHLKKAILGLEARGLIISAFRFAVEHDRIYLRAFVVMPDHWHALFALREPWTLPKFMHDFVSYVARKTGGFLNTHDTAWQDGYYDTHVKTAKQFEYVAYYIELYRAESRGESVSGLTGASAMRVVPAAGMWSLILGHWSTTKLQRSGH